MQVARIKATFAFKGVDHLFRKETGFMYSTLRRWKQEGLPADPATYKDVFMFDDHPAFLGIDSLVWCRELVCLHTSFLPAFTDGGDKLLEQKDGVDTAMDGLGRIFSYPTGMRNCSMPQYHKFAVETVSDWEKDIKHRLDPKAPERWQIFEQEAQIIAAQVQNGSRLHQQSLAGGFMFLRDLMGLENLLYALYDAPELIHAMMQHWLEFMVFSIAKIQSVIPIGWLRMDEDICYKTAPLISPLFFDRFISPYYRELLETTRAGQKEKFYFVVDTDGNTDLILPLYEKLGLDGMLPFEVAAGCDVVKIGQQHPSLVISGGIDKRILAHSKDAIDRELDRIIPAMLARGGYIPACDHLVPHDVPLVNYQHYRQRIIELDRSV